MRSSKSFLKITAAIIFALVISGTLSQVKAQVEGDNPLEPVPGERRVRLLERLSEAFGYLSAHESGKVYDLLPIECRGGMSKATWVRQVPVSASEELLEFSILDVRKDSVSSSEGEWWVVSGCLKYQKGSKVVESKAAYRVFWRSNEWFVCGFKKEVRKGEEVSCSN